LVHLRTSDLGLIRTANSNLGTSFVVYYESKLIVMNKMLG